MVNKPKFYIVGGGTFAVKLADILIRHQLDFMFTDEINQGPIAGRPVCKAADITHVDAIFFIAISLEPYAENALQRLVSRGVQPQQALKLKYETAINILDLMLTRDKIKTLTLLAEGLTSVVALERRFFDLQYHALEKSKAASTTKIGFCLNGKGGGFRQHLCNLPTLLSQDFDIATFSDQAPAAHEENHPYYLMSEESMLQCDWPDLVINPHFFECSPPHIPKLTMMHMVYDFLVYKELVARVMAQAETHYLFIPSEPSMKLHQNICLEFGLTNNVVLIPGGYPRFDQNKLAFTKKAANAAKPNAILYAPTLSVLATSDETKYTYSILEAVQFIPAILDSFPDKTVIIRPHPDDMVLIKQGISTKRAIAFRKLLELCNTHPRCSLDTNNANYIDSFVEAEVIISDTSAIAYSFALTTQRPVIFFSADQQQVGQLLQNVAYIRDREKLGFCVESTDEVIQCLNTIFDGESANEEKKQFIDSIIYNPGQSEKYLQQHFDFILKGKRHDAWWYLRDHI